MPLSTSSFAGDGIPPSKTQVPNPSAEERTPDIVTYFVLEVEFFLQCTGGEQSNPGGNSPIGTASDIYIY
jgi:hypothetical protein